MEKLLQDILNADRFLFQFHITVTRAEPGFLELSLPVSENLMRPGDIMNGGAIMAVMDAAGGLCSLTTGDVANEVTVSLTCSFLRPVPGGMVHVAVKLLKRGGSLDFCRIEMTDERGEILAEANGVWKVTRAKSQERLSHST
ncbi:MAG TPA: PaaI family thioesterase [Thermoplasmataceae archaeon]|nr:PaaI family thioesterase [Thermoplasmataceae archaeon]